MIDLHHLAEARSLAYHRAVADRVRERPELLETARSRLRGWLADPGRAAPYAHRWLEILSGPLSQVLATLVDPGEEARALRQATPFAGFLDPRERWRIWREVREAHERAG